MMKSYVHENMTLPKATNNFLTTIIRNRMKIVKKNNTKQKQQHLKQIGKTKQNETKPYPPCLNLIKIAHFTGNIDICLSSTLELTLLAKS